jgi:hypothetical protein
MDGLDIGIVYLQQVFHLYILFAIYPAIRIYTAFRASPNLSTTEKALLDTPVSGQNAPGAR